MGAGAANTLDRLCLYQAEPSWSHRLAQCQSGQTSGLLPCRGAAWGGPECDQPGSRRSAAPSTLRRAWTPIGMDVIQALALPLVGSTFGLIFVAELPDKTALASLVLATQYPLRQVIFGAWLAFLVQTL